VSRFFRVDIPPHVAEVIRVLPPEVKHGVKEALRLLARDPGAGVPLRRELEGYWKYRVRRFRIVYQRAPRLVRVVAVGHRRTIYEELGERLRKT
jgi:mRNA interferase RelE/StbE